MKRNLSIVLLAAAACLAHAQPVPEPAVPLREVLNLSAAAAVEVQLDSLAITLAATREGADAAQVQTQLKQALDAALGEARRAVRTGQLEVRTGAFSLSPRYSNKGQISGWVGQAELVLEGRDISAIAQLAGRLGTMAVSRVGYALSRETRERVEAESVAQAIAKFRTRALDYAKQFGFTGYTVREVHVGTAEPEPVRPLLRERAMASAMAAEPIPVEAGKTTVSVSVNGSVQMMR